MARGLAEMQGGTLSIESVYGLATTVLIRLPVCVEAHLLAND
jgi:signal transduction histidine kinase